MGSTNTTTRTAGAHNPSRSVDIFGPSDFPAPVADPFGVMRSPLAAGTVYRIHGDFPLPLFLVPKVAAPPLFEVIVFEGVAPSTMILRDDDIPNFWGRDIGSLQFTKMIFVDVSNAGAGGSSVLFDLVGGNGTQSVIGFLQAAFVNVKSPGSLIDIGLTMNSATNDVGIRRGWVLRSNPGPLAPHFFSNRAFVGIPALPDNTASAISILGSTDAVSITGNGVSLAKPGNAFLFIDSGTTTGAYSITSQNYSGPTDGAFFRADIVALAITQQADASVSVSSFTDSAVAPGVATTVNFAAALDIVRGQSVLIDGGTYAGAYTVVRVADDQMSFDIAVVFTIASAGTLALTVHTVASTLFVRDETVTIAGTTNYNATVTLTRVTDTTFTTPQVFAGDDATGGASSSGRDQTSLGVLASANGAQESSKVSGEACWNGNASTTSPQDGAAAGVYVPLVLTGVGFGGQRVTLSDAASAEFTYNGESSTTLTYTVNIEGVKAAGGTDSYRIAESINGVLPVFDAEQSFSSLVLRVASVGVRTLLIRTVPVDPGDTIRPVIIGDGTTTSVTVTEGQILVSA